MRINIKHPCGNCGELMRLVIEEGNVYELVPLSVHQDISDPTIPPKRSIKSKGQEPTIRHCSVCGAPGKRSDRCDHPTRQQTSPQDQDKPTMTHLDELDL